jgi:hypothetical protein
MILRDKILAQLFSKEDKFRDFRDSLHDESKVYEEKLRQLAQLSSAELIERLKGIATPGALPTAEFDAAPNLCLPFSHQWDNHAKARVWACEALLGHTTFAVDGSQIPPHPGFSIPVAAVQIAWFENHHAREGSYVKQTEIEILSPADLTVEYEGDRAEQKINARRFELEIGKLCNLISDFAKHRPADSPLPVALFDSSLVISFADRLQEKMRERHINAMLELLQCSEAAGIPVVGYVDASDARDLIRMIGHCFGLPDTGQLHDAELIRGLLQLQWGARTPFFECKREGAVRNQPSVLQLFESQAQPLGFVYLKTTALAPPARLEIPMWVYRQGLLDEVLDIVRAEVIVGNGYPYAIEAADATAVISTRDREAFYALFQQFAEKQGIELRVSPKAASKVRRRYN